MEPAARYRVQHKFWLDLTQDEDDQIDAIIHRLKDRKQFTEAIRLGLLLIDSLNQESIELLVALHPWIIPAIAERYFCATHERLETLEQLLRNWMEQQGRD